MLNYRQPTYLSFNQHFKAVSHRKSQSNFTTFAMIILLWWTQIGEIAYADSDQTAVALTNFSFASYLGNGFYSTSGQRVFVLQLPFDYTIKTKTDTEAGVLLKLPLTFGIINFSGLDTEDLPNINDITTLTFLPGIEYQYPVTPDWTVAPFVDYGFARDFNNAENILIIGAGIKSYLDFHFEDSLFTLGNRFLYAREKTKNPINDSDYSLIETGLNYRVTSDYLFDNGPLYGNLYYINLYYPNNLVFFENTQKPIRVGVEHEIGITFSNMSDFLFFEKPQLGFGIRVGKEITVYRIIFGAPF